MKSKTVICVIGMHRSGTSAITKAISFLGPSLGNNEDLLEPHSDNPKGFFENKNLVNLNEAILNKFNRSWSTVSQLPKNWWERKDLNDIKQEMRKFVNQNFLHHHLWLWKDPRLTLLIPLWKEILTDLNVSIKFVICIRHPSDVYSSLKVRNGFSKEHTFELWKLYTLNALYWSKDHQRTIVSYDNLINNWKDTLEKISNDLVIEIKDHKLLEEKIESFLSPDLRHSFSGGDNTCIYDKYNNSQNLYNSLIKKRDLNFGILETMFKDLHKQNIYIWGTGNAGKDVFTTLKEKGIHIDGFIDNDSERWFKPFLQKEVYPPNFLDSIQNTKHIVVGSMYFEDIKKQLLELGYKVEKGILITGMYSFYK